jgi:hypothetical protein
MTILATICSNLGLAEHYALRSRAGLIAALQGEGNRVQMAMDVWGRDAEKWDHILALWNEVKSNIRDDDSEETAKRLLNESLNVLRGRLHWNAENYNPRNQLQVSALCKVIEDIQRI